LSNTIVAVDVLMSMMIEMRMMTKTILGRGSYLYYMFDKTNKTNTIAFEFLRYCTPKKITYFSIWRIIDRCM